MNLSPLVQKMRFRFSLLNYHVFVLVQFIGVLGIEYLLPAPRVHLTTLAFFGCAGMLGETLVSVWWRRMYSRRFWEYESQTLFHRYTSWLNFVPWAIGGWLSIALLRGLGIDPLADSFMHLEWVFLAGMGLLITLQYGLFRIVCRSAPSRTVTAPNALFFYAPIALTVAMLAYLYGSQVWYAALAFAVCMTFAEYMFGKFAEFFVTKKLWVYTYSALDRGHFTPLSIPLFIAGGFYFWALFRLIA